MATGRGSVLKEFLVFLMKNKMWYLTPIILVLLILGILLAVTQGTAIAPFIYTMF